MGRLESLEARRGAAGARDECGASQSLIPPWSRHAGPAIGHGALAATPQRRSHRCLNSMAPQILPSLAPSSSLPRYFPTASQWFDSQLLPHYSPPFFLPPLFLWFHSSQNFSNGESVDLQAVGIRGRFVRDVWRGPPRSVLIKKFGFWVSLSLPRKACAVFDAPAPLASPPSPQACCLPYACKAKGGEIEKDKLLPRTSNNCPCGHDAGGLLVRRNSLPALRESVRSRGLVGLWGKSLPKQVSVGEEECGSPGLIRVPESPDLRGFELSPFFLSLLFVNKTLHLNSVPLLWTDGLKLHRRPCRYPPQVRSNDPKSPTRFRISP
jgi:hypothetical protein